MSKCHGFYYNHCGKKVDFKKGLLLYWGSETNHNGYLNTVAIIKLEDGTVITAMPRNIKFYT